MWYWHKTAILLTCVYGILKKIRPGTPFLTPFLESEKNLTNAELYGDVFPCWTYSNLFTLVCLQYVCAVVPIFFLSDLLQYRPILILEAVSLFITWFILVYGDGVRQMQIMQIFFGVATSSEVAFFSYLYAVVDARHYKQVTSYISSASMCGRCFGYSLGQILVSADIASLLTLNKISLYAFIACIAVAICLPSVSKVAVITQKVHSKNTMAKLNEKESTSELLMTSLKCNTSSEVVNVTQGSITQTSGQSNQLTQAVRRNSCAAGDLIESAQVRITISNYDKVLDHPVTADVLINNVPPYQLWIDCFTEHIRIYRNPVVLDWSIWWALTSCGMFQIFNYIQTLWAVRQQSGQYMANGFVECLNTLIGAITSFLLQYCTVNWRCHALTLFIASSFATAALLFVMIEAANVFVDYGAYLCLATVYNLIMIVASHEIAIELSKIPQNEPNLCTCKDERDVILPSRRYHFSTVFGLNTLAALLCQSTLTRIFADKSGLFAFDIESQFRAYAVFFCVVGGLFSTLALRQATRIT